MTAPHFKRTTTALPTVEKRRIASGTIVLDLPMPPSVNNLQRSTGTGQRYDSAQHAAWKQEAGWTLQKQRPMCAIGPVEVRIYLQEPTRARDADNTIKPVLDLLVKHGIIDGDNNKTVRKVSAEWSASVIGARVEIERAT